MLQGFKKAGWLITAFAVFSISLVGYIAYTYQSTRTTIMAEIDDKLFNAAISVQHILGTDYHTNLNAGITVSPPEYTHISHALSDYAKQAGLAYVYTMVLKDGQVYFSSSSFTQTDQIEGKVTRLLDSYPEATATNLAAFYSTEPVYEISQDRWGHFKTIFVPYIDDNGISYLTGADITINHVNAQLKNSVTKAAITACFFFFLALLVVAIYYFQVRRSAIEDYPSGYENHLALNQQLNKPLNRHMELAIIKVKEMEQIISVFGNHIGDRVMQALLEKLTHSTGNNYQVFRLSTGKAALLLSNSGPEHSLEKFTSALFNNERLFVAPGIFATLHVGVARGNKALLLENAHLALQQAEQDNTQVVQFENLWLQVDKHCEQQKQLTLSINSAIENHRITPYFSPIYRHTNKQLHHYQCEYRMVTQQGKVLAAEEFIPTVTQLRLTTQVTKSLFLRAMEQFNNNQLSWSFPLTESDLFDNNLILFIIQQLREHADPSLLHFEISAHAICTNLGQVLCVAKQLKSKGAKIIINEFGVPFADFSKLMVIGADGLKLHPQLLAMNSHNLQYIALLHDKAKKLGYELIVTGVSQQKELITLKEQGIQLLQGPLISDARPFIQVNKASIQQLS